MHELLSSEESGLKYLCFMNFSSFLWVKTRLREKKPISPNTGENQYLKELQPGNCCNLLCNVSHDLCQQWTETSPPQVLSPLALILSVLRQHCHHLPWPPCGQNRLGARECAAEKIFPPLFQVAQEKHRWQSTNYCYTSHRFPGDMYDHSLFYFSHVQKLIKKQSGWWTRREERGGQSQPSFGLSFMDVAELHSS